MINMMIKPKKLKSARRAAIFDSVWTHALIVVLAALWLFPIFWMIIRSFSDIPGVATSSFFPDVWTFANYKKLFATTQYSRWMFNTLWLALANAVLSTIITLGCAYALSRYRFKMRKPFMNIALILGMFPGFMAMIAVFLILDLVGLINEPAALLLVYVSGAGLTFFVSKGYFDTVPISLDEAALVDGATQLTIFVKIILPLSKTILIYTAMLAFMAPWTDFILAGLILKSPEKQTVAVGLYNMTDEFNITSKFAMFTAGCILVTAPIVTLYVLLQRFMIAGLSSGAVKG